MFIITYPLKFKLNFLGRMIEIKNICLQFKTQTLNEVLFNMLILNGVNCKLLG